LQQFGVVAEFAGRAGEADPAALHDVGVLARPRATVANCSISSTPVPDSAMAAITGIRRLTTTGARPSDNSSISM
jgi:hypothetical protein